MNRYRVDLYVNEVIVASLYRSGCTRADAWHFCRDSKELQLAQEIARKKCVQVYWDASIVKSSE